MKSRIISFFKENKWTLFLFCYHLLFVIFAYQIRIERGISDSHFYWAQSFDINKHSWFDFLDWSANFIVFLNYPLLKIGVPFFIGFLIYGIIGFFGILKWMQWTDLVFENKFYYKGINLLYLLFLLPNLHFWTAAIGKEPIVFWGIAAVFYAIALKKYNTFSFIVGSLMVLTLRPHVALMLFSAVALVLFFDKNYSLKKRISFGVVSFSVLSLLLYLVFQLTHIRYWNWKRITYFNDYSILSFKYSGSYVPMLEYNYFYKLFSFNFRPLFYDANSLATLLSSIENIIVLLIHLLGLFFVIKFYRKMVLPNWVKIAFLFTSILSILYVQRYANLGIFMRTKMMFHPFMLVALLYIIKQGVVFQKSKS